MKKYVFYLTLIMFFIQNYSFGEKIELKVKDKSDNKNINYDLATDNHENLKYLEKKWQILENLDKKRIWENFFSTWGIKQDDYRDFDLIRNRKGRIILNEFRLLVSSP